MAIAYYIPDQAKLLTQGVAANNNANAGQANNRARRTAANRRQQQQQRSQQQPPPPPLQQHGNHIFNANISIPLPHQQGSMTTGTSTQHDNLGCWDLLVQIFCYALRCYNYSSTQRTPTVIQISFEISTNASNSDGNQASSQQSNDNNTPTENPTTERHSNANNYSWRH